MLLKEVVFMQKTVNSATSEEYQESQRYLLTMLNGVRVARCLQLIAQLGIPDLLQSGSVPVTLLAEQTGSNEQALYRVLRALGSVGIVAETSYRHFSLTARSMALPSGQPGSIAGMAAMMGDEWYLQSFERLDECVRTGEPVLPKLLGTDLWTYFATRNPEAGRHFDSALTGIYEASNRILAESYAGFAEIQTLVDVGGGEGNLLLAILQAHPQIPGILFDRLEVIQTVSFPPEFTGRVEIVGGDFFQSVPAGADAYILRQVLHDHNDLSCVQILERCRNAMATDGRVLIVERVLGPESSPADLFLDVQLMLHLAGARERTKEEFSDLCGRAGLSLTALYSTHSPFAILEARYTEK